MLNAAASCAASSLLVTSNYSHLHIWWMSLFSPFCQRHCCVCSAACRRRVRFLLHQWTYEQNERRAERRRCSLPTSSSPQSTSLSSRLPRIHDCTGTHGPFRSSKSGQRRRRCRVSPGRIRIRPSFLDCRRQWWRKWQQPNEWRGRMQFPVYLHVRRKTNKRPTK